MKDWIKKLSNKNEILLILLIGFGYFIVSSNIGYISPWLFDKTSAFTFNTFRFSYTITAEILFLSVILYILYYRGFSPSDLNLDFSIKIGLRGILLFALTYIAYAILINVFLSIFKIEPGDYSKMKFAASFMTTISALIVNSFYEEFLLNGYIFKRFEGMNNSIIILISVGLRVSYHTYQGVIGIIGVIIIGVIFSIFYSRIRLLWPIVIAHGLINLSSIYMISHQ